MILQCTCISLEVEGHYTNHSLRCMCATALFQICVEKLHAQFKMNYLNYAIGVSGQQLKNDTPSVLAENISKCCRRVSIAHQVSVLLTP